MVAHHLKTIKHTRIYKLRLRDTFHLPTKHKLTTVNSKNRQPAYYKHALMGFQLYPANERSNKTSALAFAQNLTFSTEPTRVYKQLYRIVSLFARRGTRQLVGVLTIEPNIRSFINGPPPRGCLVAWRLTFWDERKRCPLQYMKNPLAIRDV